MKTDSAHQSGWAIAEVVFGLPFLFSLAMQFIIPFSVPLGVIKLAVIPVGIALIITGVVIISLARREFARYAQPTDPDQPTSQIIKTGLFSISRNPLYLGAVIFILGLALLFNLPWVIVTLPLSMVLCHFILIISEEKYLAGKFGAEYQEYARTVHRWLGRH